MSGEDATIGNGDSLGLDDDDRLPWLESAEDYDGYSDGSTGKTIGLILLGLVILAAVVGSIYWLQQRGGGADEGDGSMIAAQEGDYKVAPDDPQGKTFEGTGDASPAASEGEQKFSGIGDKANRDARASTDGVLVQLGAFSTEALANSGWTTLSGKYDYVGSLPKKVVAAKVEAGTVYRLSAVAANASAAQSVCNRLKAAGQSCLVVR